LILSNSIRLRALAETEIKLIELPNDTTTLLSLEAISGVGKVKNNLVHLLIPEKSRFDTALHRMALAIESSSVAAASSRPTTWRFLRREGMQPTAIGGCIGAAALGEECIDEDPPLAAPTAGPLDAPRVSGRLRVLNVRRRGRG
jgi:hypothetical protein